MPREIVHWAVLDRAVELLPAGHCLATILNTAPRLTYLGAMSPDALYYHSYGRDEISNHLGEKLHGRDGDDTFLLVKQMSARLLDDARSDDRRWAFIAGYLSHCAADIVFHPWVFYCTGDYYDEDIARQRKARIFHRLFEVYLDSWFHHMAPCRSDVLMRFHLDRIEVGLAEIAELVGRSSAVLADEYCDIDAIRGVERWREALEQMALQQGRFRSDGWGRALRLLNGLMQRKFDPIESLCSYRRRHAEPYFSHSLRFRNPVSGDLTECTMGELTHKAVELTLEYWNLLRSALQARDVGALAAVWGPSLNYGVVRAPHHSAIYYDESPPAITEFGNY